MRKLVLALQLLLLWITICLPALAQPSGALAGYLRYQKGAPGKLETAVVSFRGPAGQKLDLIAAVHIGEPAYYKDLNTRFKGYDAVLYEMILPQDLAGQPLPAMEASGGLAGVQGMMSRTLGLTSQIERIDYSASNLVHADLTQEGLAQSMKSRQESFWTYLQKILMSSQGSATEVDLGVSEQELAELDLLSILSGTTSARDRKVLKKMMAQAMSSPQGMGALGDTALLDERNKAALQVLDAQVAAGKRSLALFYGAAHMPDLEARLREKGWKRVDSTWLQAWSI